jgi:hypothetical protein
MTGFTVHVEVLRSAARGITETMRDMQEYRIEDLSGDEPQYGHEGVHEGFEHFCGRWQEGLELLLEDAGVIAEALAMAASSYGAADQTGADTITAAGVVGGIEN